jgi:hypothetical protein
MKKTYKTSDLALAAYLVISGFDLVSAKKSDNGKFEFEVINHDNEAEEYAIAYINSDFCKFDNQIRTIKKLIYNR